MRRMETIHDLIEEAKIRFLWWAICIFAITYFLSHTSKSMWMNVPIAVLIALLLRVLANEVEFRWKASSARKQTTYLEKKQLPVTDTYPSSTPAPPTWKRKFDSPIVEAAVEDFVDRIIQDFITDLWYSGITSDKEAPELMRVVILDALGEVAERIKQVNLVDLLTRDLIDLIGDHLELYRRTQACIGVDIMVTLSSEERDEQLKRQLMASNDLHPALVSAESEHKVLQQLTAGLLSLVLKPSEVQCPLVKCIAREFVTCLIVRPIMNLVTPLYINELLEFILLHIKDFLTGLDGDDGSSKADHDHPISETLESGEYKLGGHNSSHNPKPDMTLATEDDTGEMALEVPEEPCLNAYYGDSMQPKVADWARKLDAATQRRTEVLAPENLEKMWAIGRHYKEKINKVAKEHGSVEADGKMIGEVTPAAGHISQGKCASSKKITVLNVVEKGSSSKEVDFLTSEGNKNRLRRSSSTSDLKVEPEEKRSSTGVSKELLISEDFHNTDLGRHSPQHMYDVSGSGIHPDGSGLPKLKCRVLGAYYDKTGSKSFAVYAIAVTDAHNNMWFVKRRYRNFERLHRNLKEIPNYSLQLPPKRIFSSSTEDAFVHRRCIKLDKYLQDLLSIPNVAEQHEVWDFLSASSKNYSFGKSSVAMQSLAVNVDDAVDDIVRQFNGVPDGLLVQGVGSSSGHDEEDVTSVPARQSSLDECYLQMRNVSESSMETAMNFSDNEEGDNHDHDPVDSGVKENGWHSDNELNSKSFPPRVVKQAKDTANSYQGKRRVLDTKSSNGGAASLSIVTHSIGDHVEVPPEWTPPNVTVPMLNLVDKLFQLKKRGWIRRQVFWISRQMLQLVMEDAVDDWLLGQINWLRREEVIAQGIRWVKDLLWPDGKFFLKLEITGGGLDDMVSKCFQATPRAARNKSSQAGSFEMQLEASRRASYIRNFLYHGAPAPLVSFVGQKQYKRCARDIYFFLQSTVCLKQVAYAILELVLVSIFPELKDVVADIHPKAQPKTA